MGLQKPKNIFITGANRGLGLEMVKQIISRFSPNHVFATYRDTGKSKELLKLAAENKCLHLIQLDMKDNKKFDEIATEVDKITYGTGINLLVNNAGMYSDDGQAFDEITKETLMEYLEVNTVSNVLLTKALFPLLEKASVKSGSDPVGAGRAAVICISSSFASMTDNDAGGYYCSRASRTALNALTKNMSVEFIKKKIMAIILSPGWVQTDQGGPNAPLKPKESVDGMLNVIEKLSEADNGKFLQYDGKKIAW